ncbi:MAG TPA: inositol monophosphatase family protein, partial [Herpetosiphonaceae bacterium]|nr:inositol monophosphatase family protein [Herpetosiphonaceae bacterium]
YLPALDEMVVAGQGLGCTLNGRRVRVSAVTEMADAVFLTSDVAAFSKRGRQDVYHKLEQATRLSRTWGDCYGHILVATGQAEMMLDAAMNVWDCAALLPILQEAGGTFTDWEGNATIHGPDAFSTNGYLFERVLEVTRGA